MTKGRGSTVLSPSPLSPDRKRPPKLCETVSKPMVWLLPSSGSMTLQTYLARITNRWRSQPVAQETPRAVSRSVCQTIVVVGAPELRPPLADVVGAGAYQVVFVEAIEGAHSQIAQAMPDRVILCCDLDDASGFQLLSMLKADRRTRHIPALTCVGYTGSDQQFFMADS
jgi:CheY-like chemotaxis protein